MKTSATLFVGMLFSFWLFPAEKSIISFDRYHTPEEVIQALKTVSTANPDFTRLVEITRSHSGKPIMLLEIGPETGKKEKLQPAILVVANLQGTLPLTTEAALYLIQALQDKPDLHKNLTWYIIPLGNPDAAARFFQKPLFADERNGRPVNDDMDDQTDEDGCEDLNKDGIITKMRKKDPEGEWVPVSSEPRLLRKANTEKGEKGVYKLYSEGIDNDGDGVFNEDPPGGVNPAINFPHLFQPFQKTGGTWAGSESETVSIFQFIFSHAEIAMTMAYGESNFCMIPPRSGRRGETDLSKIKIPKRIATFFGADPDKTYTLEEIKELAQPFVPQGMELTESMIANFLGLGAVVNPLPADLTFYTFLSEKYKEFLKANKADAKRLETPDARDGSFELWTYYHLGLPSFSMDFWTLPELPKEAPKEVDITPEKLEKMSSDEFIALGAEKIGAFMKSAGAPANLKPEMAINMVKQGQLTTKKMAEMLQQMPKPKGDEESGDPQEKALLAFSDKELGGKGFVDWKAYSHPQLGEVEIGGAIPLADTTPPARMIRGLLGSQVPWVFTLAEKLAKITILKTEAHPLGGGLYRLKVWVENWGYLPYPTAMGRRNNRIGPVVVELEGKDFRIVEGLKRTLIRELGGSRNTMVSWILQAEKPVSLTIRTKTKIAGQDAKTIVLGGK